MNIPPTTLWCSLCGPHAKTYSSREDLEIHVSSHYRYTPYDCNDCLKAEFPCYKFPTKHTLMKHYEEVHPDVKSFTICEYYSPETKEAGAKVQEVMQQSI